MGRGLPKKLQVSEATIYPTNSQLAGVAQCRIFEGARAFNQAKITKTESQRVKDMRGREKEIEDKIEHVQQRERETEGAIEREKEREGERERKKDTERENSNAQRWWQQIVNYRVPLCLT